MRIVENVSNYILCSRNDWTNIIKCGTIYLGFYLEVGREKKWIFFHFSKKHDRIDLGVRMMKSIGFIYKSDNQIDEIIKANNLDTTKEYLIRIHTCVHNADTIKPFIDAVRSRFPKAGIIGCSTTGVIFEGEIHQDCCLVCITGYKSASVRTAVVNLIDEECNEISGCVLAESLSSYVNPNTRFLLNFFSNIYTMSSEYVKCMDELMPQVQMLGGFANTSGVNGRSFVFNEEVVSETAAVIAAIDSERMNVHSEIVYASETVGDVHTITETDGLIIRKIDGINAVDWFEKMLGIEFSGMRESEINETLAIFPIVRDGTAIPLGLMYSPQNDVINKFKDEPKPIIYTLDKMKVGEKIRMAYSAITNTIDTCEEVCQSLCDNPSEVLFGYSCTSRENLFKNCAEWELSPFKKTNLCGALLEGEIGNKNKRNYYCNYSFAIASLSENNSRLILDINKLKENANSLVNTQQKVINFILTNSCSNDENSIMQRKNIEKSLFIDEITGIENISKCLYDFSLKKFDKICMLTIRNESTLKAFLSESKFNIYFKQYYNSIISALDEEIFHCYIYKKTALIITAGEGIDDNDFVDKMTYLQNMLTNFKFSSYVLVSEFAIVLKEDEIIRKAELTLVRMRNKNIRFLVYTPQMGLEQYNATKMKMLTILNDALSNGRVVPYFQGIRDNFEKDIYLYEALMRIEDDKGNIYTPYHFMDIAKEYGYYQDISYAMITKVFEIFRDRKESVTININISDIYSYKIVNAIITFLENAPHPDHFIFELTETEEITDYQVVIEFSEKIHNLGGKIAIDDFGSGFSNLVSIFKINADYIKVDGEIVKNIVNDTVASELFEFIAMWSGHHNKEVVAEFVENEKIQEIVENNKIKFSQGYLFSKPERFCNNAVM